MNNAIVMALLAMPEDVNLASNTKAHCLVSGPHSHYCHVNLKHAMCLTDTIMCDFCSSFSALRKGENTLLTSSLQLCQHTDKHHSVEISWWVLIFDVSVMVKGAFPIQAEFTVGVWWWKT